MKKKIGIIDDYLPMLDSMRMMLELHHYEVEITQDGMYFLEKNSQPDLFLIDYHIPGTDVHSICKQIKNNPLFNKIPIILMTGHKDIKEISALCGADDFITKPFDFEKLLMKIENLCSSAYLLDRSDHQS